MENNFRGGPRHGGFRPKFNAGPREMHKTTCSECGNECEVPFKPAEGRPVYCKNCYMSKKPSDGPRSSHQSSGQQEEENQEEF